MPRRSIKVAGATDDSTAGNVLAEPIRAIEAELDLTREFAADVLEAAEQAAANPKLPELDRTDIAFITIDPAGSKDLDQALHIERREDGFRVHYAIADVAAFVEPGGPVDVEAHRRGQTLYAPEHRIPLHPPVLSEDAASLLPDQVRPALLWSIDLDERGEGIKIDVERALVRSRAQLDYVGAQAALDDGSADEVLLLLKEVGQLRWARERERGGISLPLPEQEVDVDSGRWSLNYRKLLPVEEWNAQISLLTGMGAAEIMLYGEEGIVRTLPPAPDWALAKLRRTAAALKIDWHPDIDYPDFVRTLDPNTPTGAAMLNACTGLLRGAGYVAFDGGVPEHIEHAALANEYAHVTAPLRRLADRYAGEVAVAMCADTDIPTWVRAKLRELPKEMNRSTQLAHRYERMVFDLVEAAILKDNVGETFEASVVDLDDKNPNKGRIVLTELAVEAPVESSSPLPLGTAVQVTLAEADPATRTVLFTLNPDSSD